MSFLDLVTPWEGGKKSPREGKKEVGPSGPYGPSGPVDPPKNLGNCAECGARMVAKGCPVCEDFDNTLKEMEYLSKERGEI